VAVPPAAMAGAAPVPHPDHAREEDANRDRLHALRRAPAAARARSVRRAPAVARVLRAQAARVARAARADPPAVPVVPAAPAPPPPRALVVQAGARAGHGPAATHPQPPVHRSLPLPAGHRCGWRQIDQPAAPRCLGRAHRDRVRRGHRLRAPPGSRGRGVRSHQRARQEKGPSWTVQAHRCWQGQWQELRRDRRAGASGPSSVGRAENFLEGWNRLVVSQAAMGRDWHGVSTRLPDSGDKKAHSGNTSP